MYTKIFFHFLHPNFLIFYTKIFLVDQSLNIALKSFGHPTGSCCDHVIIDGTEYSGEDVNIDQMVGNNFTVHFASDGS